MPNYRTIFFHFTIFISSAVSAERYKESSFEIEKNSNLIYASNAPGPNQF